MRCQRCCGWLYRAEDGRRCLNCGWAEYPDVEVSRALAAQERPDAASRRGLPRAAQGIRL